MQYNDAQGGDGAVTVAVSEFSIGIEQVSLLCAVYVMRWFCIPTSGRANIVKQTHVVIVKHLGASICKSMPYGMEIDQCNH